MALKRFEGIKGKIPQKFIDSNLANCPICGTDHPNWSYNMKMRLDLEGNKVLFKCSDCGAVLSARAPEVMGLTKTPVTANGLIKKFKGKKNSVFYMIIEDVGTQTNMKDYAGVELPLEDIMSLRSNQNTPQEQYNVDNSSTDDEFKFCTNCGAKLKANNKFCSKCGAKL